MMALLATCQLHAAINHQVADVLSIVTNSLQAPIVEGPKTVMLSDGTSAEMVLFCQTTWVLKNEPQSVVLGQEMQRKAMALPERERLTLMDRFDDYSQLWYLPLDKYPQADARRKKVLSPTQRSHRYFRELAFLGTDHAHAWYAYMPLYQWTQLQKQLRLRGGDDRLAAAVRGMSIDDLGNMTRGSAQEILTSAGSKAIPFIHQILASTNFSLGLQALGPMKDKSATALLLESARSENKPVAEAARYVLETSPRAEAEPLYLKWLEEDAGRKPVFQLLSASAKINPRKLAPYLPRILESPKSIHEFRQAFELSRSLAGKPMPASLLHLEAQIKQFGYASSTNYDQARVDNAVREILKTTDIEAAGIIGIGLAVAVTKGDWVPANKAGVAILRALPNGWGRTMARRVANSIPDEWIKETLKDAYD
jgi:hypothetical protein